jgi:Leucine-rich repeat (LRR) protein
MFTNTQRFLPNSFAAAQVLNMARNSLTALPPELSCLTNLTELDVGRNQLTALPAALCSLSQLQVGKGEIIGEQ